jgi:hypothetical protein
VLQDAIIFWLKKMNKPLLLLYLTLKYIVDISARISEIIMIISPLLHRSGLRFQHDLEGGALMGGYDLDYVNAENG